MVSTKYAAVALSRCAIDASRTVVRASLLAAQPATTITAAKIITWWKFARLATKSHPVIKYIPSLRLSQLLRQSPPFSGHFQSLNQGTPFLGISQLPNQAALWVLELCQSLNQSLPFSGHFQSLNQATPFLGLNRMLNLVSRLNGAHKPQVFCQTLLLKLIHYITKLRSQQKL